MLLFQGSAPDIECSFFSNELMYLDLRMPTVTETVANDRRRSPKRSKLNVLELLDLMQLRPQ